MVLAALAACRPGGTYLGLPADKPSLATPAPPATSLPRRPSVASAHQPTSGLAGLIAALPRFEPPPVARPISVHSGPSAPIFSRLPVTAPVAFLTIDDGIVQLPSDLALMNAAHIPFTMFLIGPVAAANPGFFARLEADGGVIEDHTMTHPILRGRSYAFQRSQICGARTTLAQAFDGTPTLFRPPYGDYDRTTLRVVHDCGLTAAINSSETVRNGKVYYQTSVHKVRPGDIILMHFRTTFAEDLKAALIAIHQAGLTPALLTDYITATPATRRLTAVAPDPANRTSLRAS
jgi:peptidoglycan/xylan/chitin deacetylase (PgdA/CDA1 family)